MTEPAFPHPRPIIWIIAISIFGVALPAPFAQREDWLGWAAFIAVVGFGTVFCGAVATGMGRRLWQKLRENSVKDAREQVQGTHDDR